MQDGDPALHAEVEREYGERLAKQGGQQNDEQEDSDEGENSDMDIESESDDNN